MNKTIYNVLKTFEDNSYEAYVVGGYTRDKILKNEESFDVDITTNAKPKDVKELFPNLDIKLHEYGNVSFELDNYKFDITTFRKDISYNNRRPDKIVYVDSLKEDINRRDFTINTICFDKDLNIIDYYDGIKDLKKKIIKSVGNADEKFKEDPLRILRAIRFSTYYKFKLDKDVKNAIINNKELLRELSYERKKEELSKIFCSNNKKYGINLLKKLELLEPLELKNIDNVKLTNDLIGVWATITDVPYAFTKKEKELIKKINLLMNEDINDVFVQYRYGFYPISVVGDLKKLNAKRLSQKYNDLPIKDRDEINITPEEICEILQKEPGNFIKDVMEKIEKEILLKKLVNEKEIIKKYIKENF